MCAVSNAPDWIAANSFMPLVNVRSLMNKIGSAEINRDSKIGPGSGALSKAARSLLAWEEIFADYGDITLVDVWYDSSYTGI